MTETVTNQPGDAPYSGRTFTVRLVRNGERYGRNHCLTHDRDDPLVEFYDASTAGNPAFDAEGQFVSRYYLSTLRKDAAHLRHGLDLCGHVDVWTLDGAAIADAMRFVDAALGS